MNGTYFRMYTNLCYSIERQRLGVRILLALLLPDAVGTSATDRYVRLGTSLQQAEADRGHDTERTSRWTEAYQDS